MKFSILVSEVLIFIVCVLGVIQICFKSALPFEFYSSSNSLFVLVDTPPFQHADKIISINNNANSNIRTNSTEETEFIMDSIFPGDKINVQVIRDGKNISLTTHAINFFVSGHIAVVIITGFAFFFIGIIVYYKGTERKAAVIFHWAALATAVTILCTSGNYRVLPLYMGLPLRIIFQGFYLLVPVFFYHFAAVFPVDKEKEYKRSLTWLYSLSVIIILILNYYFTLAFLGNENHISRYVLWYNILRVFLFSVILASIYTFAKSYIGSESIAEKKKLKWLLLGFITGPLTYILFWVVPQGLQIKFIPETVMLLLMVTVPITFSIAITRYRLFDIDVILNKSIVYSIVLTILGFLYMGVIYLFSLEVGSFYERFTSVIAAFAAVVLFNPVKARVQLFIDKKFFRVHYNYREALNKFYSELRELITIESVNDFIGQEINNFIPVQHTSVILPGHDISYKNHLDKFEELFSGSYDPIASADKIESGIACKINNIVREENAAIIYPLFTDDKKLLGILLIGEKKSGKRFNSEDTDLLKTFAARISFSIERITLQQKYIAEQLEKEKFAELDKMKSFFVSGASHELKTPLTSIKMYAEILGKLSTSEEKEYLEIINGECDRLARIIDNLLDISRIERGEKNFILKEENLVELINRSLKITEYHLKSEQCLLHKDLPDTKLLILADADEVISAIVNLITNGIKYSLHPKKICVSASTDINNCNVTITDNGPGINEDDIKFLMTPYFRTRHSRQRNIEGSGIGLALVKHIIEGHQGNISVKSSEEGTSFTLSFPSIKEKIGTEYEKSIAN